MANAHKLTYTPYNGGSDLFLTQEGNYGLKSEILKLLEECSDVIKICSFIITDDDIYNVLLDKAKKSKTAIFILTQLDESKLQNSSGDMEYLTEEELQDNSKQKHFSHIQKLYENGAHVRTSDSAHAKFIIADRKIGIITSANLTTPSLSENTESGFHLADEDVMVLDHLFDSIFLKGTNFNKFLVANSEKTMAVQSKLTIKLKDLPDINNSNLRYTYEKLTTNLYQELVGIITAADKFLFISTYSIVGLHLLPEFTSAIERANQRGVEIKIFCRGMNYRTDHLLGSTILKELGCELYADYLNHSKGIISEKSAMIFTANIDGNHGLKNGFEVGYILSEQQRLEFLNFHKYLISISDYIFDAKPLRNEFFKTYKNYEKSKNIKGPDFPENIIVNLKKGQHFEEKGLSTLPIFYAKSDNDKFLACGNILIRCNYSDGIFDVIESCRPRFDLQKFILNYKTLKITNH
ncbi:MAG: phospholipase D-like domain-containing protein [Flavobacterium sp. JAD_PAG50586_2]|nr:MAG: phospholipase D-like domain-containing protein [Flavobacterium sp. JAD_PAG50586_2]